MNLQVNPGTTPINPDESAALIPTHIITQEQLNEWEQTNIIDAEKWAFAHNRKDILNTRFCLMLHKKMFNKAWEWAGRLRKTNKNIGVAWEQISMQLLNLWNDVKYQLEHNVYAIDELAIRFHHRLVYIHPFPNGNGRHARMLTDLLLFNNKSNKFSWGDKNLILPNEIRKLYIEALRQADKGNYRELLQFIRK
jgi:Fic-DOC domain mobile mystery protein B